MSATVMRGDARRIPLADNTVDLVVTSPPYFGLRSYTDGCPDCADTARAGNRGYMERYCPQCSRVFTSGRNKCHVCNVTTLRTEATKAANAAAPCNTCNGTGSRHYAAQIGAEPTPAEFVDALLDVTRECVRVLKPTGSLWVNLGDKYSGAQQQNTGRQSTISSADYWAATNPKTTGVRAKSLYGIPWRYALRCIDDLGLILRAEVIWAKPNGLPESVTDRVRRSHEQWFHFTLSPRYYSAVDEVREQYTAPPFRGQKTHRAGDSGATKNPVLASITSWDASEYEHNPLGKLPGSVWSIPTQPLTVPASLGVDHFAAFPMEFPRRIIRGWSPAGVCTACGEGRRPVSSVTPVASKPFAVQQHERSPLSGGTRTQGLGYAAVDRDRIITGYACACPDTTAPTRPGIVLDPFGGTGTTALVADTLGRHGITLDASADYCRLAQWRTTDPGQRASAMQVDKPAAQVDGQEAFDFGAA